MFKINNKRIFLSIIFLLILPYTYIYAVNSDSVYVWSSNNSQVVSTSTNVENADTPEPTR